MSQDTDTGTAWITAVLGQLVPQDRITAGSCGEPYVRLPASGFAGAVSQLSAHQFALTGLVATEDFMGADMSLLYIFEKADRVLILVPEPASPLPSLARVFPSASWFERECRDGFGTEFAGAFDTRRLFLHETYPDGFHPLKKSVTNAPVQARAPVSPSEEYAFRTVCGDGVYQVPVGPVHAGIIEPGHFRFSVIGETIFNLEVRLFYKHRGIEKLAEGKDLRECTRIAEAVSGDESVANATAFCMAAERISWMDIPDRAWYIRTILLEMERIAAHLGDQAGMLIDVAFPLGANQFAVLREDVMRMNGHLTGSRFLRGMVTTGGVAKDIPESDLRELAAFFEEFKKRYRIGLKIVLSTASVIDRFATTGIVSRSLITPLALSGPVARASGSTVDVRTTRPYGIYDRYAPKTRSLNDGDVLARFTVKAAEITDSVDLICRLVAEMPAGPVLTELPGKDGFALTQVESARGRNLCWLEIRGGRIWRYKVLTASFCNWQAIEHAVIGNILPDFPLINKSLNLSYAGTDL
jgi:Ni,Fe-hydrogenase III large subunit/Ni,Fe-hydrogenase III component G